MSRSPHRSKRAGITMPPPRGWSAISPCRRSGGGRLSPAPDAALDRLQKVLHEAAGIVEDQVQRLRRAGQLEKETPPRSPAPSGSGSAPAAPAPPSRPTAPRPPEPAPHSSFATPGCASSAAASALAQLMPCFSVAAIRSTAARRCWLQPRRWRGSAPPPAAGTGRPAACSPACAKARPAPIRSDPAGGIVD